MRNALVLSLAVGLIASPFPLAAQEEAPPVGTETRAWLDLQKGGTAASPAERSLPGEIADRQFERYANSFSQPIPETFDRDSFVSEGGGQ